jgi:hypothetical protein
VMFRATVILSLQFVWKPEVLQRVRFIWTIRTITDFAKCPGPRYMYRYSVRVDRDMSNSFESPSHADHRRYTSGIDNFAVKFLINNSPKEEMIYYLYGRCYRSAG